MKLRLAFICFLGVFATFAFTQEQEALRVGDNFGGGVIIYLSKDGNHGIVCEEKDRVRIKTKKANLFGIEYDLNQYEYIRDEIGDPEKTDGDAANYFDWRLPSYAELWMLLDPQLSGDNFDATYYVYDELKVTVRINPTAASASVEMSYKVLSKENRTPPQGRFDGTEIVGVRLIRTF